MDLIQIQNDVNSYLNNFKEELEKIEYQKEFSGSKYEYINMILNTYIESKSKTELSVYSSTSWGLAKAYMMYLNERDRIMGIDTPEKYKIKGISKKDII